MSTGLFWFFFANGEKGSELLLFLLFCICLFAKKTFSLSLSRLLLPFCPFCCHCTSVSAYPGHGGAWMAAAAEDEEEEEEEDEYMHTACI